MFGKYSTCIFTVCQSSCAIICDAGQYCLVDSHSRSCNGMVCSDGTSVVLCFGSLDDLANHISNLAAGFGGTEKLFEIAGVVVTVVADRKRHLEVTDVSKKFKMADISSTCASDVEVISVVTTQHAFCPMLQNDSKDVCQLLNIDCEVKTVPVNLRVGPLGAPCKKESIVADGNCFFRAISQAVSGTQKNHRRIRLHVVKHMEKHCEDYEKLLRSEYNCLTEYISVSKMKYVNSWATEVEIQAAADSLGINIFTFYGGHWLRYSSTSESSRGIYLDNSSGNHYECVTCVNEGLLGSCFGICRSGTPDSSQHDTRSHKHLDNQEICEDIGSNDVNRAVEPIKEKRQSMITLIKSNQINFICRALFLQGDATQSAFQN
uniref:OTU domain-containing protein 3-like n=1 Tax=Doryrhamphus excisus TaxID=161450 RepID=UPI0025AEA94D|nr:OTU domain-containing protein 3-like [Doryrhamphus excisus]